MNTYAINIVRSQSVILPFTANSAEEAEQMAEDWAYNHNWSSDEAEYKMETI